MKQQPSGQLSGLVCLCGLGKKLQKKCVLSAIWDAKQWEGRPRCSGHCSPSSVHKAEDCPVRTSTRNTRVEGTQGPPAASLLVGSAVGTSWPSTLSGCGLQLSPCHCQRNAINSCGKDSSYWGFFRGFFTSGLGKGGEDLDTGREKGTRQGTAAKLFKGAAGV